MAAPGTDAAEGDEGRSSVAPQRATGWRVPSVETTRPGLPAGWGDFSPAPPAPIVSGPVRDETDDAASDDDASCDAVTAPRRRRRGLRLRRRTRHDQTVDHDGDHDVDHDVEQPAELDLVALDAEDHAWTDRALAALEDPGDDDLTLLDAATAPARPTGGNDPWSVLADELCSDHIIDATVPAPLDLETEFWAGGTR